MFENPESMRHLVNDRMADRRRDAANRRLARFAAPQAGSRPRLRIRWASWISRGADPSPAAKPRTA